MTKTNQFRRYKTILVDPPWPTNQRGKWGASEHYELMSLDRIKAMPIADLAEDDSFVWLWTTNATLPIGYDVLRTWGFRAQSPITWWKYRNGLGLGHPLRNATEHLILGIRGEPIIKFRAQSTILVAPVQEHSHKPEEQYAIIERMGDGPYLELFARRHQPGWDVWGNEIQSNITIPGYPVPSDHHHRHQLRDAA